MRRYFPLILFAILLLCYSMVQAAPPAQPPANPIVAVSNAGQASDLPDRILWRAGDDISDPAPNWREPGFGDGAWGTARPAWRDAAWTNLGPLDGPAGPDHIWYSNAAALSPDSGNGINFPTRFNGANYNNGYTVPPGPDVLFLRKNLCLPLNAVPRSPVTGQLEIMGIDQYVAWINGTNQVGMGGGASEDTYAVYSAIVPIYAGHNVLAIRARHLQLQAPAALIYRLSVDYDVDPGVLTIAGPADVIVGQPLTLQAQVNGNPGDPPYTYGWDLGDGTSDAGPAIVHTYTITGVYTVLLTVTDSYPCSGTVSMQVTVHAQPPLTIAKTDSPDPVVEGGLLNYSLVVHNGGTIALAGVVVTDTIPAGTTFVSCSPAPCSEAGGMLTWSGVAIPAGGDATVSFQVQVGTGLTLVVNDRYGATAPGALPAGGLPVTTTVVQPTVTPTPNPTLPPVPTETPPPPTATPTPVGPTPIPTVPSPSRTAPTSPPPAPPEPTPVPGTPHLVLTHIVSPDTAYPGDGVVYHTTLTNDGTVGAGVVVMEVHMPAEVNPGDVVLSTAAPTEWTGNILWVAWQIIPPGATVALDLPATVGPAAPREAVSIARVQDYGLEAQAILHILPRLLPVTGAPSWLSWGWFLLAGGLIAAGLLLRRVRRVRAW